MKMDWKLTTLASFAAFGLYTVPALAQVQAGTSEVHVYAGQLIGDDLTDTALSGQTPEVDDDLTYGIRYGYNVTDTWGLELAAGYTPTSVTRLSTGDIDLDITTIDLDAVWHWNTSTRFVPYLLAGVGYASADLDRPIQGLVSGQPVSIDDDSGFTLNAGIGAKYYATDRFSFWAEGRYRYVDGLVDAFDDSLNTFEPTLGVGWQF
jgi:outer membrane beta-barrel protein